MLNSCKMVEKQSEAFHTFLWHFFQVWKRMSLHIVLLKCPHVQIAFFEIPQLWQSGFSRVYSNTCYHIYQRSAPQDNHYTTSTANSCYSCSFEPGIIKIGQSSHKMYNNNILNFQESTTILNAYTKKSRNLLNAPRIYIYIYIYIWWLSSRFQAWPPLLFHSSPTPYIICVRRWLFRPAKLPQILPPNWHNRSVLFAVTLLRCKIDFAHLRRWLLRQAQFSTYVTVSVVTLWTRCWPLFAFANQTFVSAVLHTAILKEFYAFVNQFPPLTSIWSHFSHWSTDSPDCFR